MSVQSFRTASQQSRPFRLRSLAAILNRLSDVPEQAAVGPTIVEWCRREDISFQADMSVASVRKELLAVMWAELPELSLR